MSKKILITRNQAIQFNKMLVTLDRISRYQTPEQLKRNAEKEYGIDAAEAIEMSYENIQLEAKVCKKGIRAIKIKNTE